MFRFYKGRGQRLLSICQEACEWEGRGQLWAEKQDKDVLKKLKSATIKKNTINLQIANLRQVKQHTSVVRWENNISKNL